MSKSDRRWMVAALVILDTVGIALAFAAAYWLRIASNLLPARAFEEFPVYLRVSLLLIPIWLVIFFANNLYDVRLTLGGMEEYTQLAKACLYGVVSVILLSYWVRVATLSRGWLVLAWVFGVLFVGGGRFLFRRFVYRLRRRGLLRTRTLILGANEQGKAIARQIRAASGAGMEIVGFIDDFLPAGAPVLLDEQDDGAKSALRVLGGPDRLADLVVDHQVSELVVVTNAVAWETFQEIIQASRADPAGNGAAFEIKLSPGFYEILTTGVQVVHEAFVPLLLVNRERITGVDAVLKGLVDYGLAVVNLLIALPLMGLIGLALRLTTEGPVVEGHQVLACGGGTFTTWKFHTGLENTPRPLFAHPLRGGWSSLGSGLARQGATQATASSVGQVTWLHRSLYNTGLDKLPQMLNILRGEMSWVGPRTVSVGQVEAHSEWLPNLLTVKPGITGPWAVGHKRTLDEEMRLTMVYIRNWTIWLDLQIMLQTAQRILRLERSKAQRPER